MDCKRVTVIRIGPVISTRSERHHILCGAFFCFALQQENTQKFAATCAKRAVLCANGRPRKAELVL